MLLSNIPWMAPDRMAFMKKLYEQANKTEMNPLPHFTTFSNIGGNIENRESSMCVMSVSVE